MSYSNIESSYEYKCSILTTVFQYPISLWRDVFIAGCGHYIQKTWRCHLNPVCHSTMMSGSLHMDMGMGIVHVVRNVHEYIKVCQGFLPYLNVHHQGALSGSLLPFLLLLPSSSYSSSSSSSSASRVTYLFKVHSSSSSASRVTYLFKVHLEGNC